VALASVVLAAVLPAAALVLLLPAGLSVCGDSGVQVGWEVRAFEELTEWRVSGSHLRFRGKGDWKSVPLPAEGVDALRARLESAAPGRESAFRY
jgi:hypothetical protein